MRRGGRWILPVAVVLLAALFWTVFLGQAEDSVFGRVPILDEVYYLDQAAAWSQGPLSQEEPFFVSPLYPILIALTGSGGGMPEGRVVDPGLLRGIRLFQICCWWGVVVLLRLTAGRVLGPKFEPGWPREWVVWLPALLFGLYRPAAVYAVSILLELPLILLVTLTIYLMTRMSDRAAGSRRVPGDWGWPLMLGLVIGLAALLRGTAFLLVIPAAVLVFRKPAVRRLGLAQAGMMLAASLVVLAPAALHNSKIAGRPVGPTLNAGVNLYIGNGPDANGFYVAAVPGDWRRDPAGREYLSERLEGPVPTLAAADRIWTAEAWDNMSAHPGRTAWLWLKKVWLHFQGWEIDQLTPLDGWRNSAPALKVLAVPFALLVALSFAGLIGMWSDVRIRWWAAAAAFLVAGQSLFFVVSRYRLALVPVFCLLAIAGAVEIGRRNRTALAAAVVAGLVTIPWGLESTRDLWRAQALANEAHRWAEVGAAEGSEAALATAETLYREALVRDASGPASWLGLASLLIERGAREEAMLVLDEGAQATSRNHDLNKALLALLLEDGRRPEALELTGTILGTRPHDADTLHNRTILLSETGRADEAMQTARALIAAHPADVRGYIDLGVILARAGRREEAHAVFSEGLRAVPDDPRLQRNLDLLSR